ncbi:MAG: glycosyltransferase family 39 protein [Deltaproteobacteria bacterium]|nr:MAG: glycosyltransferase family 39 protein [Deltaproteobacteria bacterium]
MRTATAPGPAARPRRAPLLTGWPAALALMLVYFGMAVTSVREKSTTFDELSHLTAGYSYWITGDFRLNPESGTLAQQWQALPLVLGGYRFPSLDQEAWWKADVFAVGYHFFYDQGNDVGAMLRAGRTMTAVLGVGLGLLVYAWSRRLFGPTGGILSAALYAFCPTLLAHGRLITTDLAAALFFTASVWSLWVAFHTVSPGSVLVAALAVAGLWQAKMSAVLIVPVALVLLGIRLAVLLAAAAVQAGVVVLVTWGFYRFRYAAIRIPSSEADPLDWPGVLGAAGAIGPAIAFARDHRFLPEAFLYGFARFLRLSLNRPAFLNGELSWVGWRWFFPYCLAVKTPLPLLALVAAGGVGAVMRRETLYQTAPLWVLLAVYWTGALESTFNIGHRHLLPTYPVMLVLAGGLVYWLETRGRAARLLIASAVLACVVESVTTWPHYLAYFNQLAGGPRQGYRHLVDSSLDWGQDLPGLARWLDRNVPSGTPVYLSYFGTGNPDYYHIKARRLPGFFDHWRQREWYPLTGGVYAVGATMLQSVYSLVPGPWAMPYEQHYQEALAGLRAIASTSDEAERQQLTSDFLRDEFLLFEQLRFARLCAFLRRREPDDNVGYSILIYRLSDQDVREALYGPPAELLPDVGVAGVIRR